MRGDLVQPLYSRVSITKNVKSNHSSLRHHCNSWLRQCPCKNLGNPRLERPLHPVGNCLECSLKLIHTRQRTAVANDSLLGIKNLLTKVSFTDQKDRKTGKTTHDFIPTIHRKHDRPGTC